MADRMSVADAAPLFRERRTAPAHVGGVLVFEPPAAGFDYDRLVRLVTERIALAPRYRQKVRMVPGRLSTPIWVDDPAFDIGYHVRRSALPRPGTDDQLLDFCSRIQARLLDRSRPLWEMYLVEGLAHGRVAIVTLTHEAMVDEHGGIDLAQVILDSAPEPRRTVVPRWTPAPEPGALGVVRDAVIDAVRHPLDLVDAAHASALETRYAAERAGRLLEIAGQEARALVCGDRTSPLRVSLGEQRRLAIARTSLADYRAVRSGFGGSVSEVVLAVVTGALRGWLLSRGEPLTLSRTVRALVPVSVWGDGGEVDQALASARRHPSAGGRVLDEPGASPLLVELPVGEADPVLRLTRTRRAMSAPAVSGRAGRRCDLVVTNVPGPQVPRYAAGARLTETFPVLPLTPGRGVSIGVTSYDGGLYVGINGDRAAVPDIAVLAQCVEQSLAELVARAELPARTSHERTERH